ncbi:MAG: hypothetical protein H7X88_06735 [Gloeobacteraceae cyanobacterium ES-bin-316]|nr:hypothetical protein [Ferruginibacter sp.]
MKKITVIVAALALFLSAGASDSTLLEPKILSSALSKNPGKSIATGEVTRSVSKAFTEKFTKAQNVNWDKRDEFYFAQFTVNDKDFSVAYSEKGEMLAISRTVSFEELPLAVTTALTEKYSDYKLSSNVTEVVMDGTTSYHLFADSKTRFLQLKCSPDGSISVDKKIKKKVLVGSVL